MRFRTQVREFMKKIEQFTLAETNSANLIDLLRKENEALRKQNELLFDRLMAKNFEEFAHLKSEPIEDFKKIPIDFDQDEDLAGDIVDEVE